MPTGMAVRELADRIGAEIEGDPTVSIRAAASIERAGPGELTFLASRKYLPYLSRTRAAAIIVARDIGRLDDTPDTATLLWVDDAHEALAEALDALYPPPASVPGVAPSAVLGKDVELGAGVSIGPYAVVGPGASIGDDVRIGSHCVVGEGCRVGAGTVLKEQVTLYPFTEVGARCIIHSGARLGVDGYGYVLSDGRHRKIPQVGRCVLGDDVEIGANTTIDRGSVGETLIGDGTKIDNLVQIGHNARIGRNCLIVGQAGLAGSTRLGDGVVLAGQAGVAGHLTIGDGARIAAKSGVSTDIAAGETYFGYPARPIRPAMKASAVFLRLPELLQRVRRIEEQLGLDRDGDTSAS